MKTRDMLGRYQRPLEWLEFHDRMSRAILLKAEERKAMSKQHPPADLLLMMAAQMALDRSCAWCRKSITGAPVTTEDGQECCTYTCQRKYEADLRGVDMDDGPEAEP